ncbi:unnamed protein product, partial [Discosporangium mesarthrocarpum]
MDYVCCKTCNGVRKPVVQCGIRTGRWSRPHFTRAALYQFPCQVIFPPDTIDGRDSSSSSPKCTPGPNLRCKPVKFFVSPHRQ